MTAPKLKQKDLLMVYRCALYAAMGIGHGQLPTDAECVQWLASILRQNNRVIVTRIEPNSV